MALYLDIFTPALKSHWEGFILQHAALVAISRRLEAPGWKKEWVVEVSRAFQGKTYMMPEMGSRCRMSLDWKRGSESKKKRYHPRNKALYESERVGVKNRGSATTIDGKGKPLPTNIKWQVFKRALRVPSCYSSTEFLSCAGMYLTNYFSYCSKHTSWQSEYLIWEQQNKLVVYSIRHEGSKVCLICLVPQSGLFYVSVCTSAIGKHLESFQIWHHYLCIINQSLFSSFCRPTYKQGFL